MPISFPTMYDYVLDIKKNVWMAWNWLVPAYVHDRRKSFADVLVQTIDTLRITWLVNLMCDLRRPVLLVGESGTSKTAIVHEFLRNLKPEKFVSAEETMSRDKFANDRNFDLITL